MYIGKIFNMNGTLCKVLAIYQNENSSVCECVDYQNGKRFMLDSKKIIQFI